jgi:tetratricopeptide (TPR) repeat protein
MKWLKSTRVKIALSLLLVLLIGAGIGAVIYRRGHTHRIYLRWKAEGLAASKAGDHRKAIDDLRSYLAVYLDDQEALRAYVYSRTLVNVPGDRATATSDVIFALRHLITLESDGTEDRRKLLGLYQSTGQDTELIDTADEILRVAPNDAEVWAAKATSLAKLEKWNEALPAAQKWSELAPSSVQAEMTALVAMRHTNVPVAALAQREMDRRKNPDDPLAAFLVGFALSLDEERLTPSTAEGKTADQWLKQASLRPISDPKLVTELANTLERLSLWDDSLAVLRKADDAGVAAPIH